MPDDLQQLLFRVSLEDNASPGLGRLRTEAQSVGTTVRTSGRTAASGLDALNRATGRARAAVDRFAGGSARAASTGMGTVGRATGRAQAAVDRFSGGSRSALRRYDAATRASASTTVASTGRIGRSFKGLFTSIVGGFGLATIAMKGWSRLTAIEDARAKLEGLGNGAVATDTIMANALAAVKGTAFGLDEAATAAAGAVAAGIRPGQQLEAVLKSVANSAAAAGIGIADMGAIYNKVASLGKAQNEVLQQVAERGLPIYQKLAEQFGATTDEVFKMATKGQIGFEQFQKAMTAAAGTVADEMGKTTTGMIRNMGAALGRFGATALEKVQPIAKSVFGSITAGADEAGAALGALAAGVESVAGPFVRWWSSLPAPIKAGSAALLAFVVLHGPLLKLFRLFGTPVRGIVSGLRGMTAGFTGATAAVGSFGWQMQLLQARQGINMAGGASRLGSFFTVAGRKAASFGKSLLGAVGGPAGLAVTGAIAAVTVAITKLGQAQERAKAKAEAHRQVLESIAGAFGQTGRLDSNEVRNATRTALETAQWGNADQTDITSLVGKSGGMISTPDLVASTLGDKGAQSRIRAALDTLQAPGGLWGHVGSSGTNPDGKGWLHRTWDWILGNSADSSAQAAARLAGLPQGLSKSLDEVNDFNRLADAALSQFDQGIPAALKAINDAATDAGQSIQYTRTDIQAMVDTGKAKTFAAALGQVADSLGIAADKTEELGIAGSAALDQVTKAASGANRALTAMETRQLAGWARSFNNPVVQTLAAIGDAAKSATDRTQALRTALDNALGRKTDSRAIQAEYFAQVDALGDLFAAGTKATHGDIESLIGKNGEVALRPAAGRALAAGLDPFMLSLTGMIQDAFNRAGGPGGGKKAVTAAMDAYFDGADELMRAAAAKHIDPTKSKALLAAQFGANGSEIPAILAAIGPSQIQDAIGKAAAAAGDDMEKQLTAAVDAVVAYMQLHDIVELPVGLNMSAANVALDVFHQRAMSALATAQHVQSGFIGPTINESLAAAGKPLQQANGGILGRSAMIAAGGSNILWAEPETHGEAYIPFNPAKRPRAEQVLGTVAHEFGGAYLPPAAQIKPMASGGLIGTRASTATLPAVSITVSVDARGAEDPKEVADRTATEIERVVIELFRNSRERHL